MLQGKSAFITGGSSGIGLATAAAFVAHGATVSITGRDRQRLDLAVSSIGQGCLGFVADASDDEAMQNALRSAAEPSGGLDVLFANAGHYVHSALGETSREDIEDQMSVVADTFMTVQSALPYFRSGASIILMSSVYATMGPPGAGAYAASKAAIGALARSLASELAPRNIRVNVVVPGAIDTPSWGTERLSAPQQIEYKRLVGQRAPVDRMLTAAEVAAAVLFLASDASSGLQASELVVDGGTTGALAGSARYMRGEP
jgi:NAD(P)-dependent dehydrogenase (short-subunit alcohol dehydrogenase family)